MRGYRDGVCISDTMLELRRLLSDTSRASILELLGEECAELSAAALKEARVLRNENPTPVSLKDAEMQTYIESADVMLCLCIAGMQGRTTKETKTAIEAIDQIFEQKLSRWIERLRAAEVHSNESDTTC